MAEVQHQDDTPLPEEGEGQDHIVSDNEEEMPEDGVEEELECRVCRGPPEDGRPLYAPCKCSGSIGLTHQDCLSSWLSVTRGDGRCELCSTKFQFAPKYAEGTPDHLPPYEVFLGLSRRAIARWLPFALRFLIAMSLWLLLVPLVTSYLYHGWMHRPSSIATRWKWELAAGDTVSGAVIAAFIIVSFLSLMSFGDFLRFHGVNGDRGRGAGANAGDAEDGHIGGDEELVIDEIIPGDNEAESPEGIGPRLDEGHVARGALRSNRGARREGEVRVDDRIPLGQDIFGDLPDDPAEQRLVLRRRIRAAAVLRRELDDNVMNADRDEMLRRLQEREVELNERLEIAELEAEIDNERRVMGMLMGQPNDVDQEAARVAQMMQAQADRDGDANDDRRDLRRNVREDMRMQLQREPMMNLDDPGDVDINVALDELLGLGAPFGALIRNLLWLLAFNTTYLGIFAFIPRAVGEGIYARAFNSTAVFDAISMIPYMKSHDGEGISIIDAITDLNQESARLNATLQLPDTAIIVLGYFFMAFLVLLWKWSLHLFRRLVPPIEVHATNAEPVVDREGEEHRGVRHDARRAFGDNADNAVAGGENDPHVGFDRAFFEGHQHPDEDVVGRMGEKLAVAIECASAVVKVGVLLFFKMLLLPLVLGIWLDVATLELFDNTGKDRILFAGGDVFGSVLLHWVVGITFMLLVTVSVLQLREVVHPDLLAPVIRPQEPQPDLLGNLLHEKGSTHAKRMLVSLGIYAALLTIHVWVPARVLVSSGIGSHLPFFRPKFWHVVMPQLQVPLELIVFHLCMLAFLEKYKNHIGELQHHWLSFMCETMGLTDFIVPQTVEKFVLVGSRPVFLQPPVEQEASDLDSQPIAMSTEEEKILDDPGNTREVDPFWYELARKTSRIDEFIFANIENETASTKSMYDTGRNKGNGARVLSAPETHIRLPRPRPQNVTAVTPANEDANTKKCLLSTSVGSYRLRKREAESENDVSVAIEFWREVRGESIPRPPEGWDDLGVGGAEVQGRWAWGKEKKSEIEYSVAARTPFFGLGRSRMSSFFLLFKGLVLLCLSWLASSIAVCCALSAPLFIGRFVLFLLRVPDRCVHDPLAFAIGGSILFPILIVGGGSMIKSNTVSSWRRLARWVKSFRWPPSRKLFVLIQAGVLWLFISPLCLGMLYHLILVKSRSWFSLEEPIADTMSMALAWGVGSLLLNVWALLCYLGAFTGNFWIEIGVVLEQGDANAPAERHEEDNLDEAAAPDAPAQDNGQPEGEIQQADAANGWQGENGRIARFVGIIKSVLFNWEWDRIDHVQLLSEVALPVAKHLSASCLVPLSAYAVWLLAIDSSRRNGGGIVLPLVGVIDKGLYRMVIFRSFAALSLMVQLASSFQGPLQRWFHAAHKAARDDRYLVGEVLMNYVASE